MLEVVAEANIMHLVIIFVFALYNIIDGTGAVRTSTRTCQSSIQCEIHSQCNSTISTCECNDGYIIKRTAKSYQCIPVAKTIDDACQIDIQCIQTLGTQSICEKTMLTCKCLNGTHHDVQINTCLKDVPYGGPCTQSRECVVKNGYGWCNRSKCTCPKNSFYTNDDRCIEIRKLGESCTTDESCQNHKGACINGECDCGPNRAASNNGSLCLDAANGFGDKCEEEGQCTKKIPRSECIKKQCFCPAGRHQFELGCFNTVLLGSSCTDPRECYNSGYSKQDVDCINSICTCIGGKCRHKSCAPPSCTCDPNEHHNVTDARCVTQSGYGQPCASDENCISILGLCNTTCVCYAGFIISNDQKKCLKVAEKFGDDCVQENQCTEHLHDSKCIAGKCGCDRGKHPYQDRCYLDVPLDQKCTTSPECFINNLTPQEVECNAGYCRCLKGSCRTTSCLEGVCSCEKDEYRTDQNKCVVVKKLGEGCTSDDNCAPFKAKCIRGTCQCDENRVMSDVEVQGYKGRVCLDGAGKFGDPCQQLTQCTVILKDSVCLNNQCGCDFGKHPVGQKCFNSAKLGFKCSVNEECYIENLDQRSVACQQGACTCTDGSKCQLPVQTKRNSASINTSCSVIVLSISLMYNIIFAK